MLHCLGVDRLTARSDHSATPRQQGLKSSARGHPWALANCPARVEKGPELLAHWSVTSGWVLRVPVLHRADQLVTYAFQLRGPMRQQLVLPHRHLGCQVLVGPGPIEATHGDPLTASITPRW